PDGVKSRPVVSFFLYDSRPAKTGPVNFTKPGFAAGPPARTTLDVSSIVFANTRRSAARVTHKVLHGMRSLCSWVFADAHRGRPMTQETGTFADLGLHPSILAALTAVGYEEPSPIQAQAIPMILAGHDMIGQAQTGTGKTAAFALPILTRI